ncbi:hypothetical protein Pyn_27546 [Prunus yedoensis var. nudiflora]|uniref:Uncharacterized protein n=1 Tax=Prunus yedoensis var. nudiflora TaxID=2094558 RepID=A0A314UEC2_PRUYE|nr:hypothetical protein Pyn_27546 [Prunus yedoensis var. nudiflora]
MGGSGSEGENLRGRRRCSGGWVGERGREFEVSEGKGERGSGMGLLDGVVLGLGVAGGGGLDL